MAASAGAYVHLFTDILKGGGLIFSLLGAGIALGLFMTPDNGRTVEPVCQCSWPSPSLRDSVLGPSSPWRSWSTQPWCPQLSCLPPPSLPALPGQLSLLQMA